jgi:MFS transporter, PPP family, 3-phenylpropionic acid transporter
MDIPVTPARQRISPELRVGAFYSTLFMTAGAATVFAGIWFSGKGLSPVEIGIVNAAPVLAMLVVNPIVGRLADRAGDWRQIIIAGSLAAGVVPFGLFLVDGFWGILAFWSLAAVAQMAVTPVLDAAALRLNRRRGSDFGAVRAWGTLGYMAVIVATGFLVARFGATIFLPLFAAFALLRAIAALGLPPFRAAPTERAPAATGATHLLQVAQPWFLLPLIGYAMVFASHLILNAFQSLLWKEQGIGEDVIGVLIALGALSEAAMFFAFKRFAGRFSARNLILVSAIVSAARWLAMSFSPGLPILTLLQLLHSVTYALGFLGSVNFIANWTSEEIAAEAQSFSYMLQQAMAVIAVSGFGWLVADYGAHAYAASAAFAALGGVLVWVSLRLKQPKPHES